CAVSACWRMADLGPRSRLPTRPYRSPKLFSSSLCGRTKACLSTEFWAKSLSRFPEDSIRCDGHVNEDLTQSRSGGDGAEGLHPVRIVDTQGHPKGGPVLTHGIIVRRGLAGATVDNAGRHRQLVGAVRVGAAGGDPRPGADELPHFDPFFARP